MNIQLKSEKGANELLLAKNSLDYINDRERELECALKFKGDKEKEHRNVNVNREQMRQVQRETIVQNF